jgi:hypothetical protein
MQRDADREGRAALGGSSSALASGGSHGPVIWNDPERPAILASVQGRLTGVAGWSRSRAESFSGQGD